MTYELPPRAVAEAIVNAVAHRDYASNAAVQVMLFSDRLEVWNPGELPPPLTFESLHVPHPSIPRNPLLAEPLFLTRISHVLIHPTQPNPIVFCHEGGGTCVKQRMWTVDLNDTRMRQAQPLDPQRAEHLTNRRDAGRNHRRR